MKLLKKTQPIKKATLEAYREMKDIFNVLRLVQKVRKSTGRRTTDASITRCLRYLRQEGKVDYRVINKMNGYYEKL